GFHVTGVQTCALPILVVLPTASSGSVMSRTSDGSSAISAMPPALSVIGPKASSATIMPAIDSIAVAAIAIPYRPPRVKQAQIARHTAITGIAVDFIDTPRPAMMLVPWPVVLACATCLTGGYWVPV